MIWCSRINKGKGGRFIKSTFTMLCRLVHYLPCHWARSHQYLSQLPREHTAPAAFWRYGTGHSTMPFLHSLYHFCFFGMKHGRGHEAQLCSDFYNREAHSSSWDLNCWPLGHCIAEALHSTNWVNWATHKRGWRWLFIFELISCCFCGTGYSFHGNTPTQVYRRLMYQRQSVLLDAI